MPAPQFHITFAELVQHHPKLPLPMRRACAAEPTYARLGGIFHDLPYYYAPMVLEAVRYGLGAPALEEPWGFRMHCVHPERMVVSFMRAVCQEPGLSERERLALVGGLLSHCALDLALHPLVNYCARRDTLQYGGHESTHHRMVEKFHALFFHIERFGDDPIGTTAFAERTRVTKQVTALKTSVEQPLLRAMSDAYQGAYGTAPAARRWGAWVRNFRQFGLLVSVPMAQKNSRKLRTAEFRERYYQNETFDFREFYAAAERRLEQLIWLGYGFMEARDFSMDAQDAFCQQCGIDDLAEPRPVDLPPLPYIPPVEGKRPRPRLPKEPRRDRRLFGGPMRLARALRFRGIKRAGRAEGFGLKLRFGPLWSGAGS